MAQDNIKPVLSVQSLSAGYPGRNIFKDVSFSVNPGSVFAILGGSGCGKSTLLKCMIGLLRPFSGDVLINGRSIIKSTGGDKRNIMRSFGVAYQGGALFRSLTLEENVALPLQEYTSLSKKQVRDRVREKLSLVNLDGCEDIMPSDLSGGMIKRAAFARALALDPQILFFDEPSAGLDPLSSARLDELMLDIRARLGTTIVIVTHELESIFSIADSSIMLDKDAQGIVAQGNPKELRKSSPDPFVRSFLNRGKDSQSDPSATPNMDSTHGAANA